MSTAKSHVLWIGEANGADLFKISTMLVLSLDKLVMAQIQEKVNTGEIALKYQRKIIKNY